LNFDFELWGGGDDVDFDRLERDHGVYPSAAALSELPEIAPRTPRVSPQAAPDDVPKLFYRRGTRWPRAIAWFGFRSFWGHIWHMVASVIATEDIDARNWMKADTARALTRKLAETIGAAHLDADSLAEALDDDVWIDFIADTGDDSSVSKAVARMLASEYEVDDPDDPSKKLVLPRGKVLVFGGDTAYPVATELEIHNRVIVPFNTVLRPLHDATKRALLGIPGNHDWYAGIDGFGRMFRQRRVKLDRAAKKDDLSIDRFGQIGHFIEWVEAFRLGTKVVKRAALALTGYTPVQDASYWSFRIAPGVDMWGADRQLRAVDFQQRAFFAEEREKDRGIVLVLADPAYAYLEPHDYGQQILQALDVTVEGDGLLVLTGDTHHYCRQSMGDGMHVTAGGGGAFLHPARINRRGLKDPDAEFPGQKASFVLALQAPWQIAHGRSGFVVHTVLAMVQGPIFLLEWWTHHAAGTVSICVSIFAFFVCFFLGGFRKNRLQIAGLSAICGATIGLLPFVVFSFFRYVHIARNGWFIGGGIALSVYIGTLALGTYLMLLTILGIEQNQAFSALAHPGYKHFVRLRFAKHGKHADGWVFGRVDPLKKDDPIVLVDRFRWKNPQARRE
jgi:hypothetical protein